MLDMQEQDAVLSRGANERSLGAPAAPHSERFSPQEEKSEEPDGSAESMPAASSFWWRLLDGTLCVGDERKGRLLASVGPTRPRDVSLELEALTAKVKSHAAELVMKDKALAAKDKSHAAELAIKDEALAEKDREISCLKA